MVEKTKNDSVEELRLNEHMLFNLIKSNMVKDLEKTDEFNTKDAFSKILNMIFEFKCRSVHYDTLMIDKEKYDSLMKYPKVRFIVSTPKGIYSFNIKKLDLVFEEKLLRSSTMYHREIEVVKKKVAFMPINFAKDITNILKS